MGRTLLAIFEGHAIEGQVRFSLHMANVGPESAVLNSVLHPGAKRKLWEANPEFMRIAHSFESGKFSKNSWISFKEMIIIGVHAS